MTIELGIPEISLFVFLFGILQFIISLWLSERLKASLQKENAAFVEKIRWDIKVREQAERVAEYMAIARNLNRHSNDDVYQRANQLTWELAMWLPEDLYKAMINAIAFPDETNNPLSVVVAIRKYLLGEKAGDLSQDDIAIHAPGLGESKIDRHNKQ